MCAYDVCVYVIYNYIIMCVQKQKEFERDEKQCKGGIKERKEKGKLYNYNFKNIKLLAIGSLTFFVMNRCCHEHWNIESPDMEWKALTALQAEVTSLNTTTALCRPEGVTEIIGPSADSLWIIDLRSSVGCKFFLVHLAREKKTGGNK